MYVEKNKENEERLDFFDRGTLVGYVIPRDVYIQGYPFLLLEQVEVLPSYNKNRFVEAIIKQFGKTDLITTVTDRSVIANEMSEAYYNYEFTCCRTFKRLDDKSSNCYIFASENTLEEKLNTIKESNFI